MLINKVERIPYFYKNKFYQYKSENITQKSEIFLLLGN